jgi:hypothetical protein
MQNAVTERQVEIQLDESNEIAATSASMAEEEILVSVDVKRGITFLMQRAQADILVAGTDLAPGPAMPL